MKNKNSVKVLSLFVLLINGVFVNAQWSTNGTNISNSNTGNVGIGTTNPLVKLDVRAATSVSQSNQFSSTIALSNLWNNATPGIELLNSIPNSGSVGAGAGIKMYLSADGNPQAGIFATRASTIASNLTFWTQDANFSVLERLRITGNGNVGIGTTSTNARLDVRTPASISQYNQFSSTTALSNLWNNTTPGIELLNNIPNSGSVGAGAGIKMYLSADGNPQAGIFATRASSTASNLTFWTQDANFSVQERMTITDLGNVGIGTKSPGSYKLAVEGTIGARKVVVKQTAWADYVFHDNYKLPSLKKVAQYIKQHKHLPDVPSAQEVEHNGLDVGESQAVLLRKIEELTLYAIDADKRLKQQKKIIADLKSVVEEIRALKQTK